MQPLEHLLQTLEASGGTKGSLSAVTRRGPHTVPDLTGPQGHSGNTDRCPFRPHPELWPFDFAGQAQGFHSSGECLTAGAGAWQVCCGPSLVYS